MFSDEKDDSDTDSENETQQFFARFMTDQLVQLFEPVTHAFPTFARAFSDERNPTQTFHPSRIPPTLRARRMRHFLPHDRTPPMPELPAFFDAHTTTPQQPFSSAVHVQS